MMSRMSAGVKKDDPIPTHPSEKSKKPIKTPPDNPSVPPNRSTPPYIEEPQPAKPKKII